VVLGTALRATRTFCLGLWKLGILQDQALDYVGTELIDFDIPLVDVRLYSRFTQHSANNKSISALNSASTPSTSHSWYKQGHLLLICGSPVLAGNLTGLGARGSGVGMLDCSTESLKPLLVSHLPEALIVGCPEQIPARAQLQLPEKTDLSSFDVIACGPGLTLDATRFCKKC